MSRSQSWFQASNNYVLFHDEGVHSFASGNDMLLMQQFSSVFVCESFYQRLKTKQ